MKISELRDGMSLKYEYIDIKEKNKEAYTLIGTFMTLPKKVKDGIASYDQLPGIFVGYIKGSNQLKKVHVYLFKTDKEVLIFNSKGYKTDLLAMNVNRLSATRIPKVISDHLHKLHKQYQDDLKLQMEISRLQRESSKKNKTIESLSETLSNNLKAEILPDYKSLSDLEMYTSAAEILKKEKHRYKVTNISGHDSLYINLKLEMLNNPSAMGLFREYDGSMHWHKDKLTPKQAFNMLDEIDKEHLNEIDSRLNKIRPLTYKTKIDASPRDDFFVDVSITYSINFLDKEKFEEIVKTLATIF